MKILVDAHALNAAEKTGKHHYSLSLIDALRSDHELILFTSRFSGIFYYLHLWFHLLTHSYDILLLPTSYLPILFSPLPTITIIYDLAFNHPEFHSNRKAAFIERLLLPVVVRRSAGLILLNSHLKLELTQYLSKPLPPCAIIPGLPRTFPASSPPIVSLPKKYLLYVGTLEPRKNLLNLIRAYHLFLNDLKHHHQLPPKLVLVGKPGWYYQEIYALVKKLKLTRDLVFTGYLPDTALPILYSHAQAFVYLPFYEGFGLPLIEALSFKLPVITSNHPVLVETVGPCGLTIDPQNIMEISKAFQKLSLSSESRNHYRDAIPKWLTHFTPKRSASAFNHLLKTVLPEPLPQTHLPVKPPLNS